MTYTVRKRGFMKNLFSTVSANSNNIKWNNIISRETPLYTRNNDLRSDFERDYTRIIHCNAYRRLKHKTQVFYSPENDHICTRIEHVNHVESISYTIANYLGLNTELTRAISVGHDLGHSPFGHKGEKVLSEICERDLGFTFWHEKNGLDFVDNIEILEDDKGNQQNLNLTYAVRDGIISHCGEIDENSLRPRDEFIDLNIYSFPNQFSPYTWEACVVKIADKISYIGRDLEDAISLGILDNNLDELYELIPEIKGSSNKIINNTVLINNLIYDLCQNSSIEAGLCFSPYSLEIMNKIKDFNYKKIYSSPILNPSNRYFSYIINEIYNTIKNCYDYNNTYTNLNKLKKFYPNLTTGFMEWFNNYSKDSEKKNLKNKVLFDINKPTDFYYAIICYISGMTDKFAINMYNEIIGY